MLPGSLTATTTQFLDALAKGPDDESWSILDGRYRPIIRGFVLRAGLRPEDAADIAQQTMLDLFSAIREGRYLRSRGRLRMWIRTIARGEDLPEQAPRRGIDSRISFARARPGYGMQPKT